MDTLDKWNSSLAKELFGKRQHNQFGCVNKLMVYNVSGKVDSGDFDGKEGYFENLY